MAMIVRVAVLLLVVGILAIAAVRAVRAAYRPSRDLAQAMRLLSDILAYDDAVATLGSELRARAESITRSYYKEIER